MENKQKQVNLLSHNLQQVKVISTTLVPNFKILGIVVQERCLTKNNVRGESKMDK